LLPFTPAGDDVFAAKRRGGSFARSEPFGGFEATSNQTARGPCQFFNLFPRMFSWVPSPQLWSFDDASGGKTTGQWLTANDYAERYSPSQMENVG